MNRVVVIGGGVLGAQIGLINAYWGKDVTFWLRSEDSVGRTQPKIKRYSELMLNDLKSAKTLVGDRAAKYPHGLIKDWDGMTEEKLDELIARASENLANNIHIELDLAKALEGADLVIECMAEDVEAKRAMYETMRDKLSENTILATNSSTLLPSMFAEYTGRPEKYLALHFANNIWRNNTAEVMGHPGTSKEAYDAVVEFAGEIGMVPLQLHKEQPGYILNSMLVPLLSSAQALWAKGVADPETIDRTWELGTSAPMGPFKILDVVGLQTAYNINLMKPETKVEGSVNYEISRLLKEKIDRGETGVNAGKGFYDYTKK